MASKSKNNIAFILQATRYLDGKSQINLSWEWFDVKVCVSKSINTAYLVAQETSDSLKNVVVACHNSDQLSHAELLSLFDSLSPPGEMTSYEDGLLLAIVGNSSTVVYHRVLPGMCNVLQKAKRKELF